MKRLFAVLMLFSIMLTAVPSLAAKQKSIPGTSLKDGYNGMFLVEQADSDRNCLYDEDGKLVLESPGNGVKFETIEKHDFMTNSYIYQNVVVDGKCITVSVRDKKTGNYKYGLVSKKGKILCDCKYDEMGFFSEGIAVIKQGEKYGYINTSGKLISKCQWDSAEDFKDGMGIVRKGEKYSILNKKGKVIAKGNSSCGPIKDGYVVVETSKGKGVIDSKGKEVIQCQYASLKLCGEGIVNADRWYVLNMKGKILTDFPLVVWMSRFNEGLANLEFLEKGELHIGAVNKKGKVVFDLGNELDFKADTFSFGVFKNGINCILMYKDGKSTWGYVNKKGEWVIALKSRSYEPYVYVDEGWLSDKLIKIYTRKDDQHKYGIMNAKGKVVLKCEWDEISPFVDGLAYARKDVKSGYVNTKGEMVISCDYEGTQKNGLVVVNKGGKDACFNKKGKTILPAKYKSIVIGDKVIAALKDDQILFFDLKGKPIMEEETPVVTPAPVKEEVPAAETTPAEETAPAQEEAPAENTDPPADTGEAA